MIIAQGSVTIDANAQLAQQALDSSNHVGTLMDGLNTESKNPPDATNDPNYNNHRQGDIWTVYKEVDGVHVAQSMYIWDTGKGWVKKMWDMNSLSVKDFSALNISSSSLNSSDIYSTDIVGGSLSLDLNGDGFNGNNYGKDGGFNPLKWDNDGKKFYSDRPFSMGLHAVNGLVTLRGHRTGDSIDPGNYDTTMIGPNDIKLRESQNYNTGDGDITDRVDIRSNYIQIASGFHALNPGANNPKYKGVELTSDGSVTATGTAYLGGLQVDQILPYTGWNEIKIPHGIDTGFIRNPASDGKVEFDSAIWCDYSVYAEEVNGKGYKLTSNLSAKNIIRDFDSKQALSEVLGTDVYKYHYKGNNEKVNIGPVIDDKHAINNAQYNTSEYMISRSDSGDSLELQNTIGLLIGSVHELSNQNEQLLGKIAQLEVKVNGNN